LIHVPGDKSISHRALLLAGLADGESRLEGVLPGADCLSTAALLRALGVPVLPVPMDGSAFRLVGSGLRGLTAPSAPLDCGNSGTTARLVLGLLAGLGIEATLTGDASLRSRPMRRVTGPLMAAGALFREEGTPDRLPIRVTGRVTEPIHHRSQVASAQVKSALVLAGLGAGLPVEVLEPVQSRDHTERMLRRMGVRVGSSGAGPHTVTLPDRSDRLEPLDLRVPGDISSAAFLIALGLLLGRGEEFVIGNVGLNPTRTGILGVLERMGGRVGIENARELEGDAGEPAGDLVVHPGELVGVEIGGAEIPSLIDEIPILAAVAARAQGTTVIRDAGELRVKESDRIRALALNLAEVGVEVEELPDGLVIEGSHRPLEGRVRAFHDHRIAMAFGVLGALPGNRIEIDDPSVVDVSFPGFWELLERLGSREGAGSGGGAPSGDGALTRGPGRRPVITIDGPAGSGKSTTAREVARRLGFAHLDSGSLYRAFTLVLQRAGIPEEEWGSRGVERLSGMDLELERSGTAIRVLIEGEDPGEALRSEAVTAGVSSLAAVGAVRELLLPHLRRAAARGGVVADGRDLGTVVLPDAELKVFLTASIGERARRRLMQDGRPAGPQEVAAEARELAKRDARDEGREIAPLRRPEGALDLDTTRLDFTEQVSRIVQAARALGA
jgi:3-phosphoshikimate 1-carboxyvinyltransferase